METVRPPVTNSRHENRWKWPRVSFKSIPFRHDKKTMEITPGLLKNSGFVATEKHNWKCFQVSLEICTDVTRTAVRQFGSLAGCNTAAAVPSTSKKKKSQLTSTSFECEMPRLQQMSALDVTVCSNRWHDILATALPSCFFEKKNNKKLFLNWITATFQDWTPRNWRVALKNASLDAPPDPAVFSKCCSFKSRVAFGFLSKLEPTKTAPAFACPSVAH